MRKFNFFDRLKMAYYLLNTKSFILITDTKNAGFIVAGNEPEYHRQVQQSLNKLTQIMVERGNVKQIREG